MVAPVGGLIRLNVSVFLGMCASVAAFVMMSVMPSSIVWLDTAARTGMAFISLTTTVKVSVPLKGGAPLSVTCTVIVFVLGPSDSLGVQVNNPVAGLIAAPAGGLTRLYVSVSAAPFASAAVIANVKVVPSFTVWFGIAAITGALFTSLTTTVKLFVSLKFGVPSSVTRMVIKFVLGI